jgi:hypothetical protein
MFGKCCLQLSEPLTFVTLTVRCVIIEGYVVTQIFLTVVPMVGERPTRDRKALGFLEHTLAPILWYGELYFRTFILT